MAPQGEHRLVFARLRQHGCGTTAITSERPSVLGRRAQSEPLFDDPEASDAPRRHAGGRDCLPGDGSGAGLFRAAVRRSSAAAAAIANSAAEPAVAAAAAWRAGCAADRLGARQRRAGRPGAILRSGPGPTCRHAAADARRGCSGATSSSTAPPAPCASSAPGREAFALRSPWPAPRSRSRRKAARLSSAAGRYRSDEPRQSRRSCRATSCRRPPARSCSTWSRAPSW